ncbi:MAG: glycoside hydrolase family 95-like protein [bacterium]
MVLFRDLFGLCLKKSTWFTFLGILSAVLAQGGITVSARPLSGSASTIKIPDMGSYLSQHDFIYERAPDRWLDGIPLANGEIGAMVWGDGAPLKVTLDSYSAWETREAIPDPEKFNYKWLREAVADRRQDEINANFWLNSPRHAGERASGPSVTRLPMPRLEIDFGPVNAGQGFDRFQGRLNLFKGALEGILQIGDHTIPWHAWTQNGSPLLVMQFESLGEFVKPTIRVTLDHLDEDAKKTLAGWGYPPAETRDTEQGRVFVQRFPYGGSYAVAWHSDYHAGNLSLRLALSVGDSEADPEREALSIVEESRRSGLKALRREHEAWWSEYWNVSALSIPDARLENLYYIEIYKLACSTRPDGWPITLQGLWTLDGGMPPWAGDYHLDMNVEESTWPIYTSNRLELGEAFYNFFLGALPRFKKNCKEFFGFDGAWSGCALGPKGVRVHGYPTTEFWQGNGSWVAHHYWLHWRYSMDETFLREKAVPYMKPFMQTYSNLLEEGKDGKLHIPLSNSPEYHEGGIDAWASDTTCDLYLIRFLAGSLLEANEILGLNDPEAPRWRDILDRLLDYPSDDHGLMVFAGERLNFSHRHHSHLMGIYPLDLLSIEDGEESRTMIRRSIEHWRRTGYMMWTGWAFPWASCIASRAGYPNMSWAMLDMYARGFITPSTLHVNGDYRQFGYSQFTYSPMTLEAGFASAAAIMEMLLQSWRGIIRVFPAMPDAWSDASFVGLRAEEAFLVSAARREGKVIGIEIVSEAGRPCRIKNPFFGPASLVSDNGKEKKQLSGEIFTFDTEKGKRYLLLPASIESDETPGFIQFSRNEREMNWYGLKEHPRW